MGGGVWLGFFFFFWFCFVVGGFVLFVCFGLVCVVVGFGGGGGLLCLFFVFFCFFVLFCFGFFLCVFFFFLGGGGGCLGSIVRLKIISFYPFRTRHRAQQGDDNFSRYIQRTPAAEKCHQPIDQIGPCSPPVYLRFGPK